jgi:hypothetical protein
MTSEETIQRKLRELQTSYVAHTNGQNFKHFFCPTLWVDEPVKLIPGHVFNRAFKHHRRRTVVQRADVDGFYARNFEVETIDFVRKQGKTMSDALDDDELAKLVRPDVFIDGKPVKTYYVQQNEVPAEHSVITLWNKDGKYRLLGVHCPQDVFDEMYETGRAKVISHSDWRVPSIVSILKAAHLSFFYVFGYRYGLSAAAEFLGRQILGSFFRDNQNKPKDEVIKSAKSHFIKFTNMIRPVFGTVPSWMKASIEGNAFFFLESSEGELYAIGAIVRTGSLVSHVYVPNFLSPNCDPGVYHSFLTSENEEYAYRVGFVDTARGVIEIADNPQKLYWPKKDGLDFEPLQPHLEENNNPSDHWKHQTDDNTQAG